MEDQGFSTAICERILLAYFVTNEEYLSTYCQKIQPEMFTTQEREWIFNVIRRNFNNCHALTSKDLFYVDMQQTLDEHQERLGKSIAKELDAIFELKPTDDIRIVLEKLEEANVANSLMSTMQETHGFLTNGQIHEALEKFKSAVVNINFSENKEKTTGIFSDCDSWLQDIVNRKKDPDKYAGLKTGFARFDKETGGLYPCELTMFFGLPGKGKSTVLKNICRRVSLNGHNVLFIHNEENDRQVETKFASLISGIPGWKFKRGKFSDEEYLKISQLLHNKNGAGEIYRRYINQGVEAYVIERIYNELKNQGIQIDLICIDYLDLMGAPGRVFSEWDEQAKITNSLKQLAINCNVPVLTCTQASIEAEKQEKKDNPFLNQSEVYGAKAKVHTANTLIGIVNKTATNNVQDRDISEQNIHKLIFCVCKNRDGACFTYRQNLYAQTGILEDDDDINPELDKVAEEELQKQVKYVEEVENEFAQNQEKKRKELREIADAVMRDMEKNENEEDDDEDFSFLDAIGSEDDETDTNDNSEFNDDIVDKKKNIKPDLINVFAKYSSGIKNE